MGLCLFLLHPGSAGPVSGSAPAAAEEKRRSPRSQIMTWDLAC